MYENLGGNIVCSLEFTYTLKLEFTCTLIARYLYYYFMMTKLL